MYSSASQEFNDLVRQSVREYWTARLSVNGTALSGTIRSIKQNGGSNGSQEFSIGSTVSQYVDITIAGTDLLVENKEILVEIGLTVNGTVEYIPMGLFTAEKPEKDEGETKFTAYDRMVLLEKAFFPSVGDRTTTTALLNAISQSTGVPINTSPLGPINMDKPVGYTCREVLSYIAELYGGFAVCDRTGTIQICFWENTSYTLGPDRYWDSFKHNDYSFQLDQITCVVGEDENREPISYTAGSGPRRISFSNPFMTQAILNDIWTGHIRDFEYMPGEIRFLGDPRIDPWDMVIVADRNETTYRVPAMSLKHTFDGGFVTEIAAYGKSESEESIDYKGPKTKEMERYYAQLVLIDHAMVNKLDASVAQITYATIRNLEATEARIENLEVDYGSFKDLTAQHFTATDAEIERLKVEDLTAINADITNLDAAYANVQTLLNGNAGIGDLQNIHLTSQNAIIDSALIQTMLADNAIVRQLIAGKIYTDDVEITSQDGSVSIKDSTQTFKDSLGNVRLQLGQDALGDFTFVLYDTTGSGILIDSTGIKESAIGDGLIRDRMVAQNAGIQASKLDITSLFREMNNSVLTINSSRVWVDEAGQSMNQVYTQIQSNTVQIADTSAATAVASAKAQAAQAAADQALDAIAGISTLTGFVVILSNDAHVVHTYNDGTGGNYAGAVTVVKAYLGDTDVSDHTVFTALPSAGVTGTWDATTKTYQVTDLDGDDGYVDFQCSYGHDHVYLTSRSGYNLQTRSGNNLTLQTGSAVVTKRFSISKAPDGRIGTSYDIQASAEVLRKDTDGGFTPEYVIFSALYNDGTDMKSYSGRYKIEESTDGTNFTQVYFSSAAESSKTHYPTSADVMAIRCTLYDATGVQRLDIQTVTTLIDAQGILDDFNDLYTAMQHTEETVTTYTQAVDRLGVQFEHLEQTVVGYSDGRLLFQTPYTDNGNGTVTVRARVYKDGVEATSEYPQRWFTWKLKTEAGTETAPNGYWGYSTIVPKNKMGFGGVVICRFATYNEGYLLTRSGDNLCTRSGNRIVIYDAA